MRARQERRGEVGGVEVTNFGLGAHCQGAGEPRLYTIASSYRRAHLWVGPCTSPAVGLPLAERVYLHTICDLK